jgi:hypothetical protein
VTFAITPHVEAASTLAVIAASREPLLFLAADLSVIAASASFCRAFQIDAANVPGRPLSELGAGEWAMSQLVSLLRATACPSSDDLRQFVSVSKGGSGSSGDYLMPRAVDAASGDWRWFGV